jgi:hypothetical protein
MPSTGRLAGWRARSAVAVMAVAIAATVVPLAAAGPAAADACHLVQILTFSEGSPPRPGNPGSPRAVYGTRERVCNDHVISLPVVINRNGVTVASGSGGTRYVCHGRGEDPARFTLGSVPVPIPAGSPSTQATSLYEYCV